MIGAGARRELIMVQRLQVAADGAGGQSRAWVDWKQLRAKVVPLRVGNEEAIAEGLQGVQGWRITVQFQRDVIGIENRVIWRGKELVVRGAADETGRRQNTVIFADEGVVTG